MKSNFSMAKPLCNRLQAAKAVPEWSFSADIDVVILTLEAGRDISDKSLPESITIQEICPNPSPIWGKCFTSFSYMPISHFFIIQSVWNFAQSLADVLISSKQNLEMNEL